MALEDPYLAKASNAPTNATGSGSGSESGSEGPGLEDEAEQVRRWHAELAHARKFLQPWHAEADKAVKRYLDDSSGDYYLPYRHSLNLFHSNITTLQSLLYSRIPKAEADRRFYDPTDDVARVAAEMITRIIQNDLNDPKDKYTDVLRCALEDRLIVGMGAGRMRYVMVETPGDPETGVPPQKANEYCDAVYIHWRDILWSPARTFSEIRWKAYRAYLTREQVAERFGEDVARLIPYGKNRQRWTERSNLSGVGELETLTPEAEIWEIWDSASKRVYWVVEGYSRFLDVKDDPLGLDGFYPDARPMMANTTTSKCVPKPDFSIARDLYEEIDELETRIALLTRAVRVAGVYDRSSNDVQRVLSENAENVLVPVDNWAMFAERGGLKGIIDWLPLDTVVNAINVLTNQQVLRINQLYQVTGLSDILRGQATDTTATATEQAIKARFSSGRVQMIQEEFARFATELLNKKVQIIQRFYDPQRILELSNVLNTPDAPLAQQAVALIKSPDQFNIRIAVRAESMALENIDMVRQERAALIQGIAQFLGMATPMLQSHPDTAPFLLQLLQFGISGYRGASEMEGIIDQFAAQVAQKLQIAAQQPPPPSPEQIKAQTEQQKLQMEAQLEQQKAAAGLEVEKRRTELELQKMQMEMVQKQREHELRMRELEAKLQFTVAQLQAKLSADNAKAGIEALRAEIEEDRLEAKAEREEDDGNDSREDS